MVFTVLSINALLVAYSYLETSKNIQSKLQNFAMLSVITYSLFQVIGMLMPNQFMISYDEMLLFLSPNIVIMMWLNYKNRTIKLHHKLWNIWLLFLGVNIAYFIALFAQLGPFIYSNFNIWFNENDTLHVLLILWMIIWPFWIKNDHKKEE